MIWIVRYGSGGRVPGSSAGMTCPPGNPVASMSQARVPIRI